MVSTTGIKRNSSQKPDVVSVTDDAEKILIREETQRVDNSEKFLWPKRMRINDMGEGATGSTFGHTARNQLTDNRINELPDDILIRIVSLLTLKEAGMTSVLSKRWRHVWGFYPSLNFGASEKLLDDSKLSAEDEGKSKYFRWVDQVVSSLRSPTVDEFRVQFGLKESCKDSVDRWVKFAMEKNVKRFELNMVPPRKSTKPISVTFPSSFSYSLTSLHLGHVDVTGELLESLLRVCLSLEYLSVRRSESLVHLEVAGPSLKLKSLRIRYCSNIKHLEISAPNLVSFEYYGPVINSPFKGIHKIVDLSIGGDYSNQLMSESSDLFTWIPHVEEFTLDLIIGSKLVEVFSACRTLKILDVRFFPQQFCDLLPLCSLLKACPLLQKFVFQACHLGLEIGKWGGVSFEVNPHYHLRVVEIVEFVGWTVYRKFAEYLIESGVSLEKMIITQVKRTTPWQPSLEHNRQAVRSQVEELRKYIWPRPLPKIELLEENPMLPWWS